MQHIFLDESGQFYQNQHESVFVIGTFITTNPKLLSKNFKKWQRTKFPQKLRYQAEVKFSDKGLTTSLKLKTLQFIANEEIKVIYSFVKAEHIPVEYKRNGRILTGKLYTHVVGETLASYYPSFTHA